MATWSGRPAVNGDDGHCRVGVSWQDGSYDYIGNDSTYNLSSYVRFPNITIAKNSTVSAATITFTCGTSTSGATCKATVGVSDEDNAAAPTTEADAAGRAYAASSVSWNPVPAWTIHTAYATPDFSSSVQTVLARASWASGNAMLGMTRNNASSSGARRIIKGYNTFPTVAPLLSITYTEPAAGTTIPVFMNQYRQRWA